jgi:protease I
MTASGTPLQGMRVAFLATDGVEEVEYTQPRAAAEAAGAMVDLVSLEPGSIQAVHNDINPSAMLPVDRTITQVRVDDYDALVLPGGAVNPDRLRVNADAMDFVHAFFEQEKPVAAICHGPWSLAEADVVEGRTLTSYPSLQTDLVNAGAIWVDMEVVVDAGLVTSRRPSDLPAFSARVIEEISEGRHVGQAVSA